MKHGGYTGNITKQVERPKKLGTYCSRVTEDEDEG